MCDDVDVENYDNVEDNNLSSSYPFLDDPAHSDFFPAPGWGGIFYDGVR